VPFIFVKIAGFSGPLLKAKAVDKKDSMSLEFVWSDEFQIFFEMGFIKHVDNKANPIGPELGKTKKKRKNKLSTIQQKLDFLFSIIYLLFII